MADKPAQFDRPLRATKHCRHYHYVRGFGPEHGPSCSLGIDLSAPGASFACMPDKQETRQPCPKREDYTEEERQRWGAWRDQSSERMFAAIAALPPTAIYKASEIDCPSCAGRLRLELTARRGYVECSTPHCAKFEVALKHGVKSWPG